MGNAESGRGRLRPRVHRMGFWIPVRTSSQPRPWEIVGELGSSEDDQSQLGASSRQTVCHLSVPVA